MAAPVISITRSYLGFKRNEPFNIQLAASNSPFRWELPTPPPGVSIDTPATFAATGDETTDVITATGSTYADGDKVYFPAVTGGAGLTANTIYFIRDVSAATFKLAATLNGSAINFTTALTAGTVQKVSTGLISAVNGISVQGPYVFNVLAINADGSGSGELCVHIGSKAYVAASPSATALDFVLELSTRAVSRKTTTEGSAAKEDEDWIAYFAEGNVDMVALWFQNYGEPVDLDLSDLRFVLKQNEPDGVLVEADDFEKVGTGSLIRFQLPVDIVGEFLAAALGDNERRLGTGFTALAEFEWKQTVTHKGDPKELIGSSQIFRVRCERDLADNE